MKTDERDYSAKELNELALGEIQADFDTFLHMGEFEKCDSIIDNLRDLGEYQKGIELAKRLCAAKLRVPADYGEEKTYEKGLMDGKVEVIKLVIEAEAERAGMTPVEFIKAQEERVW